MTINMSLKLSEIETRLTSHYDAFIVSASYEERCLSVTKNIIDEIKFDYKLRDGRSKTQNAKYLMKLAGIEIVEN